MLNNLIKKLYKSIDESLRRVYDEIKKEVTL